MHKLHIAGTFALAKARSNTIQRYVNLSNYHGFQRTHASHTGCWWLYATVSLHPLNVDKRRWRISGVSAFAVGSQKFSTLSFILNRRSQRVILVLVILSKSIVSPHRVFEIPFGKVSSTNHLSIFRQRPIPSSLIGRPIPGDIEADRSLLQSHANRQGVAFRFRGGTGVARLGVCDAAGRDGPLRERRV